ncbi:GntR family transcriptional regulator [Gulosibacter sp. 10]|uniref:GntR family transcriptional regulator n=1 Tax=Gulosibacter sp. 10 TaxID=1255570 RepID=UPI00097F5CB1|nr:GntR family transcriptional regulator [Gulosibacter sp. 10]SJM60238.1 Transcriptional regulator, GntR family [Gulosibacter sp. 10]
MSQQLETVSVVDAAAARLRDSLFAGEYAAGQELKDTRVAGEFGIARPTARAAVQQLISEGLLVRPPGHSARVRTFDADEVRDIYRIRRLIELDAVREVRETGAPLDGVLEALRGFEDLKDDANWTVIVEADFAFHSAVVKAAGSPRLRALFLGISSESRLLIGILKDQYRGGASLYEEHEELYRMLERGADPAELERAWVEHLDSAQRFVERHIADR